MVYNYPFFNFFQPKTRYNRYPYYANDRGFHGYKHTDKISQNNLNNIETTKTSSKKEEVNGEPFFEVFGLKLYFDDVLIICLIFFLYQEGVKDEYLFMALILLLLS